MKLKFLLLALAMPYVISLNTAFSQAFQESTWGLKAGLVMNVGAHTNQIGLRLNGYVNYSFTQINLENTTTFSLTNIAKRSKMWENRIALGGMLLAGTRSQQEDFVWGGLHHQSNYRHALGYNYLWYRDNSQTSQNSGGWTIQSSGFQLLFENDIFAGTGRDKYRTGHLQLAYQYEDFVFQTGIKLWTGETRGSRWEKIHLDKCPSGFRILADLPYGKTSHGIFYFGANYKLPYSNFASARIGIDSEQVRHTFQNRLSHDMILLPKGIERKTPHYPRLNEDGYPVFFKADIRKSRFYGQLGLNNVWSY
ncbi:MAG: polymorphic toxin type 23 domain-containing protein [Crocinitomicaceae bacterium]